MGNGVSTLVAVTVLRLVPDPVLSVALAAGLSILAMSLLRALHPPGGAVALTAALDPATIGTLGYGFVVAPVVTGAVALMLLAMAFSRISGHHSPFRQPSDANRHGTQDRPATRRLGLDSTALSALLAAQNQSANLGPEDTAHLIAAAQQQTASCAWAPSPAPISCPAIWLRCAPIRRRCVWPTSSAAMPSPPSRWRMRISACWA